MYNRKISKDECGELHVVGKALQRCVERGISSLNGHGEDSRVSAAEFLELIDATIDFQEAHPIPFDETEIESTQSSSRGSERSTIRSPAQTFLEAEEWILTLIRLYSSLALRKMKQGDREHFLQALSYRRDLLELLEELPLYFGGVAPDVLRVEPDWSRTVEASR